MKYTKGEILLNDEIQTGIYKMIVKDKNKLAKYFKNN